MSLKPWTIKAKANSELEILLYDMIGQDFWTGDGTTAKAFAEDLQAAGDVSRILLRINSPGGDVHDGIAIYNTLRSHPARVISQIDGLAASVAGVIAMAGDEVRMADNAMLMIHNPWSMVVGDSGDMRKMADVMDKVAGSLVSAYQRHSTMSAGEISAMMDEETWMTASEAKDKGFAEKIVTQEPIAACVNQKIFAKLKHVPESLKAKLQYDCTPGKIFTPSGIGLDITALPQVFASSEVPAKIPQEITKMPEEKKDASAIASLVSDEKDKLNDATEIYRLGKQYDMDVEPLLRAGMTRDQAVVAISEKYLAKCKQESITSGFAGPTVSQMSALERKDYSIVKAIRYLCKDEGVKADLEREVSIDIAKRLGREPQGGGMFIPTRLQQPKIYNVDGLDTFTSSKGADTVATEVRDLIELLRNKMRVVQIGGTVLSGLSSDVTFPVQLTASAITWVAENPAADVAESDATFGVTGLTPHMCTATTSFSRKLLAQSSIDVEGFVRNDIATAHALGLDYAAVQGSGSGSIPLGLLGTPNIGDVADSGNNGSIPDFDDIIALETKISVSNADETSMAYLTTPGMRGLLKGTAAFANSNGVPIWQQGGNLPGSGTMNGYPAWASNQVPSTKTVGSASGKCHAIILGNWPNLMIGEWGVLEIIVDPYAKKKRGMVEVTSYQMADFCVRQPGAFAAKQDAYIS